MQHLDQDYVATLIKRLESIPPGRKPKWGTMQPDTMVQHLIFIVRHSMGRVKQLPFFGNWITRNILRPIIINGILPIPKNIKLPAPLVAQGITLLEPGDIETLHAVLDEYLNLVQTGELSPAQHPAFGDIGVDGWGRFHVLHFEHHLKQFEA